MIQLQELTKRYGQHVAVDQLNLDIQPGELFGFLGPNGAGKTTTIKMLAGLLRPTSGRIVLAGHDLDLEPEKAKAALGFIPDRPFLYEKLSATEVRDAGNGQDHRPNDESSNQRRTCFIVHELTGPFL